MVLVAVMKVRLGRDRRWLPCGCTGFRFRQYLEKETAGGQTETWAWRVR